MPLNTPVPLNEYHERLSVRPQRPPAALARGELQPPSVMFRSSLQQTLVRVLPRWHEDAAVAHPGRAGCRTGRRGDPRVGPVATRGAPCARTPPRPLSPPNTTTRSPPTNRRCWRCRASAATRRPRSPASPTVPSTVIDTTSGARPRSPMAAGAVPDQGRTRAGSPACPRSRRWRALGTPPRELGALVCTARKPDCEACPLWTSAPATDRLPRTAPSPRANLAWHRPADPRRADPDAARPPRLPAGE